MSTLSVGTIQSNTTSPPTINNSAGTAIGTFCRAWVNFNGTGTVAIRASFNVTSITDNNTGDYTVNLTTAMPDANFCTNFSGGYQAGVDARIWNNINSDGAQTASTVRLRSLRSDNVSIDTDRCNVAIFR
jgi:hypothetical protein